ARARRATLLHKAGSANDQGVFPRRFALTVAVLVVMVAVFGGLGLNQGPKLASAQLDLELVTARADQQLRLFANQAVAAVEAEQVTVTPAAPVTVTTSGDVIALQFESPLLYNTHYTVSVEGVTSAYVEQPETLSYEFTTAAPSFHYLDRGEDTDEIIATSLTTDERTVVYSAPNIQDYAVFDGVIAVATTTDDGTSALVLVNADGNVEQVALPEVGIIDALQGDAGTGTLGFLLRPAAVDDTAADTTSATLFTVNLNAGRLLSPVVGLDGQPLAVIDWAVSPVTHQLLVFTVDQTLLSVDTTTGLPLPLGQFTGLESVSTDGTTAVVTDPFGAVALSLLDGTTERLDPSPLEGQVPAGGRAEVVPTGGWVQQVADLDELTGRFKTALVFDDGDAGRIIYRTLNDEGSIGDFALSPNNQYVVVETVPAVAVAEPDGYPTNPRATTVTTVFIDISTGAVQRSVEGFRVSW
ncbi:MAG: hypothetical protein ABWY54_08040, partial [Glaciihabitans sp.]